MTLARDCGERKREIAIQQIESFNRYKIEHLLFNRYKDK
jgi:hypothetical protein